MRASPYNVCGSGAQPQLTVCRRGVWRLGQDSRKFKAGLGYRVIPKELAEQLRACTALRMSAYIFAASTWAAEAGGPLELRASL